MSTPPRSVIDAARAPYVRASLKVATALSAATWGPRARPLIAALVRANRLELRGNTVTSNYLARLRSGRVGRWRGSSVPATAG